MVDVTEYTPTSPLIDYECPLGGTHTVPGDDVRVLKVRDGGFVIACDCGDEPLEETHEPPHDTVDIFGNVGGNDPRPGEWLVLEELADGWYDTDPWAPVDDGAGTWAQHRHQLRERAEDLADEQATTGIDGGEDRVDVDAREVECPNCGANAGTKCQRPSGHSVRKCHGDRVEAAIEDGVIDAEATDRGGRDSLIDHQQQRFDAPDGEHDPEPLIENDPADTVGVGLDDWQDERSCL